MSEKLRGITFNNFVFRQYEMPNGYLSPPLACHALWYYYLIARNNYERNSVDPIVYEGEPDPEPNFRQIFSSIATIYGIQPENMVHYWTNVDMQCDALDLPRMPDEEKYRFNQTVELKTQ